MPYTSNPYAPKARKLATNLVKNGIKKATVARMYGVHRSTLWRWMKRATKHPLEHIPTNKSRPHSHPNQLPKETVEKVITLRKQTKRCAQILHTMLQNEGVAISLSSVKRILKRYKLTRRKKRQIQSDTKFRRPPSDKPGALLQMDTIYFVTHNYQRFYIYAVIDTYSRVGYAEYQPKISPTVSIGVIHRALQYFSFPVAVVQTDNGQEFGQSLSHALSKHRIKLRHTRVRKPNDNAHVERFIRTIQEECFDFLFPNLDTIEQKLSDYIEYYNKKRLHLGIQCQTPIEMLPRS